MKKKYLALTIILTLSSTSIFADSGPKLTRSDCAGIIANAVAGANIRDSDFRPEPATTKMQIACLNREGKILGFYSMYDAWVGSVDIAKAKAYTAASLSSNENALTSRDIGFASQPGGPLWEVGNSNRPGTRGRENIHERGFIQFPGGLPLYKEGKLVGGIGVSGDSVDADESVAVCGAVGYEPDPSIKSSIVLAAIGIPYTTQFCTADGTAPAP